MGITHRRRQNIHTWQSACWSHTWHWAGPLSNWAADFPEGYKNLIILKTLTSVRFVVLAYKYWLELSQRLSTTLWLKISSKQTTGLQKFYFLEKTSQNQHADNRGAPQCICRSGPHKKKLAGSSPQALFSAGFSWERCFPVSPPAAHLLSPLLL